MLTTQCSISQLVVCRGMPSGGVPTLNSRQRRVDQRDVMMTSIVEAIASQSDQLLKRIKRRQRQNRLHLACRR